MIVSVLQIREQGLISSTLHSLEEAKKHAQQATKHQQKSLQKMIDFAQGLHHVLTLFALMKHLSWKIQHFMAMSKAKKQSSRPINQTKIHTNTNKE